MFGQACFGQLFGVPFASMDIPACINNSVFVIRYFFFLCFQIILSAIPSECQTGPISGPEVIKTFSCSTQLGMKCIMLINVKMPTIVGILTFISMINKISESLKARKNNIFQHFIYYEQLKFHTPLG